MKNKGDLLMHLGAWAKEELLVEFERKLFSGEATTIQVRGWSMFPLLRNVTDRVELVPANSKELKGGDVVVFKYKGRFLLHRIVKRCGDFLLIKGDGVPFHYETALCSDVLAVMKTVKKGSGKVISVDSNEWQNKSRIWNSIPPIIQYVIVKPMVFVLEFVRGVF